MVGIICPSPLVEIEFDMSKSGVAIAEMSLGFESGGAISNVVGIICPL